MDISDSLRDPFNASLFAALATAGYIHFRSKINGERPPENNEYIKPAILVAILVYFIVCNGVGGREVLSSEPF
jgi:hypothetical protein